MPTGSLMLMSFMPQAVVLFLFGGGGVFWKSCKQTIFTKSTMEVELATLDTAGAEAEWLCELLFEDHVWFEDRWMVASLCDE
jgi:hypothetical protein